MALLKHYDFYDANIKIGIVDQRQRKSIKVILDLFDLLE